MRELKWIFVLWVFAAVHLSGCSAFPKAVARKTDNQTRAWQVKSTDRPDYFEYLDEKGKIVGLGYDKNRDGEPEERIDFLSVAADPSCPHYFILLDGIPFTLVQQLYHQGHFRLFYPPSKLVSTFPSNTDVAYSEIFTPGELLAFEALYYDRTTNKLSNGNDVYLSGKNAPWEKYLDYRVSMFWDPIGYLNPGLVFNKEMSGMESTINRKKTGTVIVYSVGTATVGTRKGLDGLMDCLQRVDNLCEKIVYERRGRCQITIWADHGHNLANSAFFDVAKILKANGYHVTNKLCKTGDVIVVEFGLLTYSGIYTDEPEKVATTLLDQEPVNLAIYPQTCGGRDTVVVRGSGGSKALVSKVGDRYRYEMATGDPLKLRTIIERLRREGKVDANGGIDAPALFQATVDHEFPDPLFRIWRGFHGLAQHPVDLVVTLNDGWFSGNPSFARTVDVKSTHGSLNRRNSVTFIMSTIKPLPKAMRIEEVPLEFSEVVKEKKK